MRLSSHEEDFFNRLKNVNLSARDRAEIRLRSPALADAIAEYQQKHIPNRPTVSDIKNILPELHPHQSRGQQQADALYRMGYSLDLENLKINNPWDVHHLPAMLIIEQIRPQWAPILKNLAAEKHNRRRAASPLPDLSEEDSQDLRWDPFEESDGSDVF